MKKLTALIVEDNTTLANILASLLETLEVNSTIKHNGRSAAEYLQTNQPDLILLDIHIPELSGTTLLKQIRANDKLTHTKVIVLTADQTALQKMTPQADLLLLKPVDTEEIEALITQMQAAQTNQPAQIYHITQATSWSAAQQTGRYTAASLHTEGFIHCSTKAQLIPVANSFYHGQTGLTILCIQAHQVEAEIKHEDSHQDGNLFPHIYGPLNLDAVTTTIPFPSNEDGSFTLPPLP